MCTDALTSGPCDQAGMELDLNFRSDLTEELRSAGIQTDAFHLAVDNVEAL